MSTHPGHNQNAWTKRLSTDLGPMAKAALLVVSIIFFTSAPLSHAQVPGQGLSLGGITSSKASGISLSYSEVPTSSQSSRTMDQITYELRLLADLDGFLAGDRIHPGAKGQIFFMHSILSGVIPGDGPTYSLRAGPGLCAGYVKDGSLGWGFLFGLSAEVGMQFFFKRGISVNIAIGSDIASHLRYTNIRSNTLTMYKSGLTRTWMPQLGVSYNFDRQRYTRDILALASPSDEPATRRNLPVKFGVEWGLGICGYGWEDYVFKTPELFPVEGSLIYDKPLLTAAILGSVGFMASPRVLVSLQGGWQGIQEGKRIYPVTIRGTYYFLSNRRNGSHSPIQYGSSRMGNAFFLSLESGAAFAQSGLLGGGFIGKGSIGYRLDLGWDIGLELGLGLQYTSARPVIYDHLQGEFVPKDRVWKSDGYYISTNSYLAIRF